MDTNDAGTTEIWSHQAQRASVSFTCCRVANMRVEKAEETVSHYLLQCSRFDCQRHFMMRSVTAMLRLDVEPTEGILLRGSEFTWGRTSYGAVARAVMKFVRKTHRFSSE